MTLLHRLPQPFARNQSGPRLTLLLTRMSVSVSPLAPRLVGRESLPPVWTPEAKPRNATEAITAMHDLRSWSVLCEHLRSQAYPTRTWGDVAFLH